MSQRTLRMLDFNNKKHCLVMVEVNFAPTISISTQEMEKAEFVINWQDGSQGLYKLIDIIRFPFGKYYSYLTYPSHGMDYFEFYTWFKEQHPEVDSETPMAAYFYRKIPDQQF